MLSKSPRLLDITPLQLFIRNNPVCSAAHVTPCPLAPGQTGGSWTWAESWVPPPQPGCHTWDVNFAWVIVHTRLCARSKIWLRKSYRTCSNSWGQRRQLRRSSGGANHTWMMAIIRFSNASPHVMISEMLDSETYPSIASWCARQTRLYKRSSRT